MYVSFCYCLCFFCERKLLSIRFAFCLFSRVFWCFLCCLLWCLIVTCLLVFVNIWILFVCDWKLMSITFAYYRLARSKTAQSWRYAVSAIFGLLPKSMHSIYGLKTKQKTVTMSWRLHKHISRPIWKEQRLITKLVPRVAKVTNAH